jgi:hypothetical protein
MYDVVKSFGRKMTLPRYL